VIAPARRRQIAAVLDLDAYLQRIGYAGSRAATIETLHALHRLHPQAIAFENLDPLAGRSVALDLTGLQRKLVEGGRGGYCFEHNLLFSAALRQLGFQVTWLAGRVLWGREEDAETTRSHMALRVDLAGESWIADVGFGARCLTAPLRLALDVAQPTPHEPFRLVLRPDGALRVQAHVDDSWKSLYRFDLTPQFLVDYEVANHYLTTHPDSHFRHHLLAARSEPGRRYGLFDNQLSVHTIGGASERHTLASVAELRAALTEQFRIVLPDSAELDAAFARLV
jgi:N-hydroxyarylamine O-acetyltransferase